MDVIAGAAESDEAAPESLRRSVIEEAMRRRAPGRPAGTVAASPIDAYRTAAEETRMLLASLAPADWSAPVAAYDEQGWDVQGLVGHLVAVERYCAGRVDPGAGGFVPPEGTERDHIAMSMPTVLAQAGQPPEATLAAWVGAADEVMAAVEGPAGVDLERRVSFHGMDYRLGSLLVARGFELWIHGDDIRDAVGRDRVVPDASRLTLMTDLAVRALRRRLARVAARDAAGAGAGGGVDRPTVRLVLTGAGGGAWSVGAVDAGDSGGVGDVRPAPDVRIVADAEAFCRLAARRIEPGDLGAHIDGDADLAARVLKAAGVLAA